MRSLISQWFFLFSDYLAIAGLGLGGVQFEVTLPFFGQIVLMENGFHWAFWNTGFAVNAFLRVDIQHLVAFVEAFYGAYDYAIGVFTS